MSWRLSGGRLLLEVRAARLSAPPPRSQPLAVALGGRLSVGPRGALLAEIPVRTLPSGEPAEPARLQGLVLVVDDDPAGGRYAASVLTEAGCTVSVVSSGAAVSALRPEHALVVVVFGAQPADGLALVRRLREEEARRGHQAVPILSITAGGAGVPAQCRAAGASECVLAPVRPHQLRRVAAGMTVAAPRPAGSAVPPRVQVDGDLLPLVDQFIAERRDNLPELESALAAGDLARVARWAHQLKGSGASYGFPELSRLGREVERQARAGALPEARAAFVALAQYLRTVDWFA